MPPINETGHAKNVAHFYQLKTYAIGYGAPYSPSKTALKLPALETTYTAGADSLSNVIAKVSLFNAATDDRVIAFAGLTKLATRIVNALDATDASKETVQNAKSFLTKIRGTKISKPKLPKDPNSPPPKTISSSQRSYDQLVQHYEGLMTVAINEPSYSPNESELQATKLQNYLTNLNTTNQAVAQADTVVTNARIARAQALYAEDTGLVDIAGEVKKYVKSLFGASSPEYKAISSLKFTKGKK